LSQRPGYDPGTLFADAGEPAAAPPTALVDLAAKRKAEATAAADQAAMGDMPAAAEADRALTGRGSQTLRNILQRHQASSSTNVKFLAGEIKDALDEALAKSAGPDAAAQIVKNRQDWHRMKQIEDMAAGSKNGVITPAKALQVLSRKKNRGEAVYGLGDQKLMDLVQAAQDIIPNGTPKEGGPLATLGKVIAATSHPAAAAAVGTGLLGARLADNALMYRGTASRLADQAAQINTPTVRRQIAKALRDTL
jgi:hypothetical protein